MSANKYTGIVEIEILGKVRKFRWDWQAISKIIGDYGPDIMVQVFRATPLQLADILVAGLMEGEERFTAQELLDDSPPLWPLQTAVDSALAAAYFGPEGRGGKKKSEDQNTKKKPSAKTK